MLQAIEHGGGKMKGYIRKYSVTLAILDLDVDFQKIGFSDFAQKAHYQKDPQRASEQVLPALYLLVSKRTE